MKYFRLSFILFLLCLCNSLSLFAQIPTVKWWRDVLDMSAGQSAAADIDGDGKLEVVFGCYRNDSCIYALNAEDGTLLWKYNTRTKYGEGCNDVAPIIYDVDGDGNLEVVVPSSCNPTTYCFDGRDGHVKWMLQTSGSDSPPIIADINGDGREEILHGQFDGTVICIDAKTGEQIWSLQVEKNVAVQTAPTVFDSDGDGNLEFAVGTWKRDPNSNNGYYVYDGKTRQLRWSYPMSDYVYHGSAVGDIDADGRLELIVGSYNDTLYCFDAEKGFVRWRYFGGGTYIGSPATITDVDNDGECEIIFCSGYYVGVLNKKGELKWRYTTPKYGTVFRGVAVADINNDDYKDIVFGTYYGVLVALDGCTGRELWAIDLKDHSGVDGFGLDHAPLIADFDNDGLLDVFIVGGYSMYPDFSKNHGRAYMLTIGKGRGPEWIMFQHDIRRQSALCGKMPLSVREAASSNSFIQLIENKKDRTAAIQNSSNKNCEVIITNILGQIISITEAKPFGNTVISLKWLPIGIYWYIVTTDNSAVSTGQIFIE